MQWIQITLEVTHFAKKPLDCWRRNWYLYVVPQYQEEKSEFWLHQQYNLRQNTTYLPLGAICFCQLLSSPCKLRSLRQVGLFLLLLAEAPVEHLGTCSPGGMGYSLCLQAQPTIALHFPPESSRAVLARQNFYMVNITHWRTVVRQTPWWLTGRGNKYSLEVSLVLFRTECATE